MDAMMTLPFNIASRCPVLSVPSGLSRDGVPTGLSVVGKTYDDVAAFRVAAAHEVTFPWLDEPGRRPGPPPG
jgi:Asp-tRNA(Asn)/Glu-tRNA(Gln) amidotransferase A subunit family amidase